MNVLNFFDCVYRIRTILIVALGACTKFFCSKSNMDLYHAICTFFDTKNFQMFSRLLLLCMPLSIISWVIDGMDCDFYNYIIICATQFCCAVNTRMQSQTFQLCLHDMFVYMITYGLMSSMCTGLRIYAMMIALFMISTRIVYGRCIFLWWKTQRNMDYDFLVFCMAFANMVRTTCLIDIKMCFLIGIFSHFLADESRNSCLRKICKKK